MDMRKNTKNNAMRIPTKTVAKHDLPTPSPSPEDRTYHKDGGMIKDYIEVWDYTCGARFRGFVADNGDECALFIFFDQEAMDQDLKPG